MKYHVSMGTEDAFTFTKPAKILLERDTIGFAFQSVEFQNVACTRRVACAPNTDTPRIQRYKRSLVEGVVAAKIQMEEPWARKT